MTTENKAFRIKDDLIVDSIPGRQLVIPVGSDDERPGASLAAPGTAAPIQGTLRFNTTSQVVEVYNGSIWQAASVAGESVTFAQAEEISIVNAIVFG